MKSPFLTSIHEFMLVKHYARSTIQTYLYWIVQFIRFNNNIHPAKLNSHNVERFLTYLTVNKNVSASTQSLALNALVFLYREFLKSPLDIDMNFKHSKNQRKLPVVLPKTEIIELFQAIPTQSRLPFQLMYGSGLRLMETVRLRVKDIDFNYGALQIWDSKGGKNRIVTLARELAEPLKAQIGLVQHVHTQNKKNTNYIGVSIPNRLAQKFPSAPQSLEWQFLFPSNHLCQYGLERGMFRYALTGVWSRHSDGTRTARSFRLKYNSNLYPCFRARSKWRLESSIRNLTSFPRITDTLPPFGSVETNSSNVNFM
ncbi:integron integrase [Vibrio viridaestus]|uniref:Integron integrase n=1 Tax=Vibrio viridaestus TaxID=2487322 RepID=A0A3N9TDG6_9VIBR|nr:integron integrase [Vibrio viridaestus]